ncbi:hypothetical protein DFA_09392 [Cavenderia fasciculata]|uniref:Uncharacterized protein n=1 Tax=Cavenderia fasciculata TaxID=261658 RepID=F4Q7H9_CACFS|nr:uncharacterized protein DFA_09392 [Cavenderia fasciculata]EGG16361.1 hypothetical protein DFA_09392 [Cavenderia fasciculata]|eukprot:XP_004354745.1 hypothetical protein DFA_09392 [Cavenderia fasciculata]
MADLQATAIVMGKRFGGGGCWSADAIEENDEDLAKDTFMTCSPIGCPWSFTKLLTDSSRLDISIKAILASLLYGVKFEFLGGCLALWPAIVGRFWLAFSSFNSNGGWGRR